MQAGRLKAGELLATPTRVYCKLEIPLPKKPNGTVLNYMIVGGENAGMFAELPDDFDGTHFILKTGEYLEIASP